jgi:VCBS repeat-containing protein
MGVSTDVLGDLPVAQADGVYAVDFQTPRIVSAPGVLGNDYGKNSMTAILVGTPTGGSVDLSPSGGFTFTPAAGACGAASFQYKALSGALESNAGTASFLIDCTPHAGDDASTVLEDSGASIITVLSNDTDPDTGQSLTISAVTQGAHGTVLIAGAGHWVTYAPNANYFGSDQFTYSVSDGHNGSATATVNVTVTAVNDVPSFTKGANQTVLEDAGAQTVGGWATNLSAGPANENGQALNFLVSNNNSAMFSAQPAIASDGTLTFTSAPDANGSATVTVQIHDDGGTANGGVDTSAAQTFVINVTAVNDAPVASNGSLTTNEDTAASGSLSASDVDGDALTYSIVANGTKGSAVITNAATGAFTYTPNANANGSDSITFRASDGTVNSNTATVSITITAVNDAPVASDGSLTTNEDTAATGSLSASDVDADALTYSLVTNGSKGSAVITNTATGAFA